MKHKYAEFIRLMANGVRIEASKDSVYWSTAFYWQFDDNSNVWQFRISTNQLPNAQFWIPWYGGENPVPGKRVVEYKTDWSLREPARGFSDNLRWAHQNNGGDIVAYRIVKQEKVVLYQWIIYSNNDKHPVLTSYFYPDETALHTVYKNNLKIVHRAEWTRIEVECDE